MQAAALIGGLLLLAPVAGAAAQPELRLAFHSPAQFAGSGAASNLTWGIFLFPLGVEAEFHALLPHGARHTNNTVARVAVNNDVVGWNADHPVPVEPRELPGPLEVSLRFGGAYGSLVVQARNLSFSWSPAEGSVAAVHGTPYIETLLPAMQQSGQVRRLAWTAPAGSVSLAMAQAGQRLTMRAEGVEALEWHNATSSCPSTPCPDGAGSFGTTGPQGAAVFLHSYGLLETSDGTVDGEGVSPAWAAGGHRLSLTVKEARLPDARLVDSCASGCPELGGETLRAEGNLTLAGLEASGDGMQARLGGSPDLFRLDEAVVPVSAFGWTATVVGLAGAAIAAPFVLRVLTLLFSRFHRSEDVLKHPKRRDLYEQIRTTPGLSYSELRASSGLSNGALQNHLGRLRQHGWVVGRRHLNKVRFFENHGRHDASWLSTATLMDGDVRLLHGLVRSSPGIAQIDIARRAKEEWGWSPSATRKRLSRLAEAGLLKAQRNTGRLRYSVAEAA